MAAEAETAASQQRQTKHQQSNFMTTLKGKKKSGKASKDELQTLELYEDLSSRDPEKHVLLQKWLKDKTCSWSSEYKAQRIVNKVRKRVDVEGFGSESRA